MHGHVSNAEFLEGISGFLGAYYIILALANALMALYLWRSGKATVVCRCLGFPLDTSLLWVLVSLVYVVISPLAMSGNPTLMAYVSIPAGMRDFLDILMGPVVYTVGTIVTLTALFVWRRFFVRPMVAWAGLNFAVLFMGLSMTDADFAAIVTKPDNVPIVGLVFLLGFFNWLSASRAVQNDDRRSEGVEPLEKLEDEKVLVWPDLVYTELICMVALTALLLLWAIGLQAPLEEPASSVKTPNPSKAPWYFLGLQEMLVYYDPWMAGVVLPSVVVFGLIAIPYIDFNKEGNGYYTIEQRKFAYLVFQFGFLVMWITLIVMGTFLRGPNWNFFGMYETWDAHKVEALNNVDLSEYFWVHWLSMARPRAPEGSGAIMQLAYILLRESLGIVLVIAYLAGLPAMLVAGSKFFRELFLKMGFLRFMVLANLIQMMALLPIKMVLRWTIDLKYFISIPEYFLNL